MKDRVSEAHDRVVSRPQRVALAVLASSLVANASIAGDSAPCPYTVTEAGAAPDCGFWGNSHLNPRGLNNLGHWVGYRFKCRDNFLGEIPILWTPESGLVNIPVPAQTDRCWAYDVNDSGTVVGARVGVTNGQSHGTWACIWLSDGQFVEIQPLGGCPAQSWASAVNGSNSVVGARWMSCPTRSAFIWKSGVITDIDPTPHGFQIADARGISDSEFVVGQFGDDSTGTGRGFRWKVGEIQILEPLPGAVTSNADSVNYAGFVAGECRFGAGANTTYSATVWGPDGVAVALPALPGYASCASRAINDEGVVLGTVSKPTQPGLPSTLHVVWLDGVPYGIESLIDAPNPTQYGSAWALNQLGQIVGMGSVPPAGSGGVWVLNPTGAFADLNGDCLVDGADLVLLLQYWGAMPDTSADLNHDGMVDGADLGVLLGAWSP